MLNHLQITIHKYSTIKRCVSYGVDKTSLNNPQKNQDVSLSFGLLKISVTLITDISN